MKLSEHNPNAYLAIQVASNKRERRRYADFFSERVAGFSNLQRRIYDMPSYAPSVDVYRMLLGSEYFALDTAFKQMVAKIQAAGDEADTAMVPWQLVSQYLTARLHAAWDHPFYVVSPSIWEAITQTDVPDTLQLHDLTMGLPVIDFLLPRGAVKNLFLRDCEDVTSEQEDFVFIRVGIFDAADADRLPAHLTLPMDNSVWFQGDTYIYVSAYGFTTPGYQSGFEGLFSLDKTIGYVAGKRGVYPNGPATDTGVSESEVDELAYQCSMWGLQLAHLTASRPNLLGPAEKRTRVISKTGKEVWTPRVLGANYSMRRVSAGSASEEESGQHVRLHVRRGHYKQQPFGKGRELRKTVWIEPYWAGGNNDE